MPRHSNSPTDSPATIPVRISLGAGRRKLPGFINVDIDPALEPDVVWDLNKVPYPFDSASADLIQCTQVYEHLAIHSVDFFREVHRILRPNGCLEIVYPNMYSLPNRARFLLGMIDRSPEWHPHHVKLVPPQYVLSLLRHVGFEPRLCYARLPWLPKRYLLSGSVWIKARRRA